MLMKIKVSALLILFLTMTTSCFAFSPEGKKVMSKTELKFEKIQADIPIGMSFKSVKEYLNGKGIKYFSETIEEYELHAQPDSEGEFAFQLAFAMDDEISGSGLSSLEKYIVVTIRFDKNSLVNNVFKEEAFKGL